MTLIASCLQGLLTVTGGLDIGDGRQEVSNVDRALLAVERHSIPHEVLSAADVHARFPGYDLPKHYRVCDFLPVTTTCAKLIAVGKSLKHSLRRHFAGTVPSRCRHPCA